MTFYMYRAQSDDEYDLQSINTANLAGVLYYLHHEVVYLEERHYNVTRILRLKVTMKTTQQVFDSDPLRPRQFIGFMALDYCFCPLEACGPVWEAFGYAPGIQRVTSTSEGEYRYPYGLWYSLPGSCMSQRCDAQSSECRAQEPGGRCDRPNGDRTCTWYIERSGEVRLDELEGLDDPRAFREAGGREYVPELDRGVGMTFWDGRQDVESCQSRVRALQGLFRKKYPSMPGNLPDPVAL